MKQTLTIILILWVFVVNAQLVICPNIAMVNNYGEKLLGGGLLVSYVIDSDDVALEFTVGFEQLFNELESRKQDLYAGPRIHLKAMKQFSFHVGMDVLYRSYMTSHSEVQSKHWLRDLEYQFILGSQLDFKYLNMRTQINKSPDDWELSAKIGFPIRFKK